MEKYILGGGKTKTRIADKRRHGLAKGWTHPSSMTLVPLFMRKCHSKNCYNDIKYYTKLNIRFSVIFWSAKLFTLWHLAWQHSGGLDTIVLKNTIEHANEKYHVATLFGQPFWRLL